MTKEAYLLLAEAKWQELEQLQSVGDFYNYEKRFAEIWVDLGRAVLESSIGEIPNDRRKKKVQTRFGRIDIANRHPFSIPVNGFQISPVMQELMVYTGQWDAYGKGVELLGKLAQVEVGSTQLYRVSNAYGGLLEPLMELAPAAKEVGENAVVYAEVDGSMILTEEGWQEVKVGRVFREEDCRESACEKRGNVIEQSEYAAYLGHYQGFTKRFDPLVRHYQYLGPLLVFLSDGATWIRNWVSEHYPNATQILDFMHVKEHLAALAEHAFPSAEKRKQWVSKQADLLCEGHFDNVLEAVLSFKFEHPKAQEEQRIQANYLRENKYRMQYKEYLEQGFFIGSGAIESAHRTVVQRRLKLSGQRWTKQGAANILNLRVTYMSNNWDRVTNLIKQYQPRQMAKAA